MQSGYSMGFLLSSLVFEFVYPRLNHGTDLGWRWMMWIGILPAFLVFFIMKGVKESPVWLDRQAHLKKSIAEKPRDPVIRRHERGKQQARCETRPVDHIRQHSHAQVRNRQHNHQTRKEKPFHQGLRDPKVQVRRHKQQPRAQFN
jgi:hypothetical protein